MGEAVVSSQGKMEFGKETEIAAEPAEKNSNTKKITAAGDPSVVNWERFLPKMVVRVLLVEADDSTRQIIAALLRKCSYRVAAVPDGLKAWELLKGRPRNIDLILTEVELPSISGYALLTLIMEHQVCKNIPVIMMSSQGSVSTVYKCMLRGATDFLVKPVRKNELRNLWQHVWRKQASNTGVGLGPPFESVTQEKDEATAENNDISNHSGGCKSSSIQRNKECIEKGSDAQSSCTKPELGTEGEETDHSQRERVKCLTDEVKIPAQKEYHRENRKRQEREDENEELQPLQKIYAYHTTTRAAENTQERVNVLTESNRALENSSKGAIDLIGGFDNHYRGTFRCPDSNVGTNKFDSMPLLDLCLRGSHPGGSVNQQNDEMQKLNHSDASPFSRYVNKSLQLHNLTSPRTCNQQFGQEINNSDTHGPTISSPKQISMATILEGQQENVFSCSQAREISHPIPVRGVRLENLMNAYGSSVPSLYTACHSESFLQVNNALYTSDCQPSSPQKFRSLVDHQSPNNSIEQIDSKQDKMLEKLEIQGDAAAPANDQNANSSYCNGSVSNIQSAGSGSNGNINAITITKVPVECGKEECFHVQEGSSHRSIQREAALTKFRLKRKDRCFEKKVRYESRKKLAEQRPRVKGQFVRQAPNDAQPWSSSAA